MPHSWRQYVATPLTACTELGEAMSGTATTFARLRGVRVVVPAETRAGERRVAAVPESVGRLAKSGLDVVVESGAGRHARQRRGLCRGGCDHRDRRRTRGRRCRAPRLAADRRTGRAAARRDRDHRVPRAQHERGRRPGGPRRRAHRASRRAGAAHLPGPVDGRAHLAGAGLRLPLRARRGRPAAEVLPAAHDRGRHRPAGEGRSCSAPVWPGCRRSRPPSGSVPSSRPTTSGPPRRRGPLDGRQVRRPRPRGARGHRRLRPRDDARTGPARQRELLAPYVAAADVSSPPPRCPAARRRCWSPARWWPAMKPGSVVVDLAAESGGNVEGVGRGRGRRSSAGPRSGAARDVPSADAGGRVPALRAATSPTCCC